MKNKKLSVGLCIKLSFGVVIALMLASFVMNYQVTDRATTMGMNLYEEYGQPQGEIGMGLSYFQEVKCYLRNAMYLYSDNPEKQAEAIESLYDVEEKMYAELEEAKGDLPDEESLALWEEMMGFANEYLADVDQCLAYVEEGKIEDAQDYLLVNGIDSAIAAVDKTNELLDYIHEEATILQEEFASIRDLSNILLGLLLVISLAISFFCIYFLSKHIQEPLLILTEAAKRVSLGEVKVKLPEKRVLRETLELCDSFEGMVANLKHQADVVELLAAGDLRAEITAHSKDDAVGSALVKLLEDDNQAFSAIRNATNQISLGSSQIAAASQTLAQGSTEQASAIQQITASVTDIAGMTRNNANQVEEVNQIILKAKGDVEIGNDRMREMVSAMKEINEASENIQKIIKVIDDIAFNTNILALNATVEAARAGEQGKGFAVVAEEVRNLAGRSAEASSQTAELIEDSIIKVRRGAELAQDTAEALNVISDMTEQIMKFSQDIAKVSNDQTSATNQIEQALMQVSQVIQTNSATSEQCASASEELSGQARNLNHELSRFQLKDVVGNMSSHTLEYAEPEINLLENNYRY